MDNTNIVAVSDFFKFIRVDALVLWYHKHVFLGIVENNQLHDLTMATMFSGIDVVLSTQKLQENASFIYASLDM